MGLALAGLASADAAVWAQPYLGFDRNDYPGDATLPALRQTFRYAGYWLNNPPGEMSNTWLGKRAILKANGFGFLVLFAGRSEARLQGADAAALGRADGRAAVDRARREGFARNVLIFLDQEEGGRLLPDQAAYLFAWIDAVQAGGARAGVYCSGIPVADGRGPAGAVTTITTAQDIAERLSLPPLGSAQKGAKRPVALWIADDRCPPSPGCRLAAPRLSAVTGFRPAAPAWVAAWQYAQSPRRARFSAACPANDAADGNCYAPGIARHANTFIDLDTAQSPDPSELPR